MPSSSDKSKAGSGPVIPPALIGPGITLLAVGGMLAVARIYEQLPLQAPGCGLRNATGIPCVACGGTRSMMALAHGKVIESFTFNPLIFVGVLAAIFWAVASLIRFRFFPREAPPKPRRLPIWLIVVGLVVLLFGNWLYLFYYLPE